jgi:hypothetical protein
VRGIPNASFTLKKKSRKMSFTRGSVKTVSTVGWKGKDGREVEEVSSDTLMYSR